MKQRLLKTIVLGLMAVVGVNAWADGVNLLTQTGVTATGTTNCSTSISEGKLTVTPSATGEFRVTISHETGISIPTDKVFFVVEMDATDFQTANQNLRNIVFGETTYDGGTSGNVLNLEIDSKKVCIYSSLMVYGQLQTEYTGNTSLSLKSLALNFKANATDARVIHSAGFYNLADILKKYSSLKTMNWQISYKMRLTNDAYVNETGIKYVVGGSTSATPSATNNGTDNGVIETKYADNTNFTTIALCKLFTKAVDFSNLPDNYRYFYFRRLQPTDATVEDLFDGINSKGLLMVDLTKLQQMPTAHKKVCDFDYNTKIFNFADGSAPSDATVITGRATTSWGTYTRSLKKGYNSCLMPFKKLNGDAPTDITIYNYSSLTDGKVVFAKVENPSANNTFTDGSSWYPVIIKAEKAGLYTFVGRDVVLSGGELSGYSGYKSTTIAENLYWVGSFEEEAPMASGKDYNGYTACYGINSTGDKFLKMKADTKTTYYRAFIADKRAVEEARELSLSFDNENGTTEIVSLKDVHGMETVGDGAIYNLQGVRMKGDNLPRGIYVKNGKKFVVK